MVNTRRPLQEKMALFWHGILCTGNSKCDHGRQIQIQLDMFRRQGMGSFPNILLELSKDPAMVFYLDNCMSHKDAINENYGRELLELFSMGVGMDGHPNYTEDDVKVCARPLPVGTIANAVPLRPLRIQVRIQRLRPRRRRKDLLGSNRPLGRGRHNTNHRPATSHRAFRSQTSVQLLRGRRAASSGLAGTAPRDPEAIKVLEEEYFRSNYDLRSMLRVLFNSEFFKNARFAKVKSPAETVVGTLRLVGDFTSPKPGLHPVAMEIRYMGQDLMNPPTVEGWHTGQEWIDSGTLVERINFAADQVGKLELPGIRDIIARIRAKAPTLSPEQLVDECLDMLGAYELPEETRGQLADHAAKGGELRTGDEEFASRVGQMLQLIVSTQEYQFT